MPLTWELTLRVVRRHLGKWHVSETSVATFPIPEMKPCLSFWAYRPSVLPFWAQLTPWWEPMDDSFGGTAKSSPDWSSLDHDFPCPTGVV
jgi:hypothetical protein